jgi:hypothetical protein
VCSAARVNVAMSSAMPCQDPETRVLCDEIGRVHNKITRLSLGSHFRLFCVEFESRHFCTSVVPDSTARNKYFAKLLWPVIGIQWSSR